MENANVLTVAHSITHLSAVHIEGYLYRIDIQVNQGGPSATPPNPVHDAVNKTIVWNLANVSAGYEANGFVNVDFSSYSFSQKAIIQFITDSAGTRLTKGGIVIKQTDFPPITPHPNESEADNLLLEACTLSKNGTNYDLNLSFKHIGNLKYKEANVGGLSLTKLTNLGGDKALEIRVVVDNTVNGNLNIPFVIPVLEIGNSIALIPTINTLQVNTGYDKWGAFYLV